MNFQKVIPTERRAKFEKLVLPGFDGVPISHVIPFVPIANFRQEMIRLFENILPANAYKFLETSIIDIVTKKSQGLLIIMLIATIIFSTNGIHAIIHAFVVSAHPFHTRSWINQRNISIVLLLLVMFMFSLAGFIIIFSICEQFRIL